VVIRNQDEEISESREAVLRAAERLFNERGYKSVKLLDIANELGVKQAALYYHVKNKEELYVKAMTRSMERHNAGLERACTEAAPDISSQMNAVARWLLSQPPLDLSRISRSDLPALSESSRQTFAELGDTMLIKPIRDMLTKAYERGEIRLIDAKIMSAVFLTMIDTIHDVHQHKGISKEVLAKDIIELFLNGLRHR
jgi:TetR/AcrR family transcriptional regulator, cholesterol catabolism regulator